MEEALIPAGLRALGPISDIPDGGAQAYPPAPGGFTGLMAVRQGNVVQVYVNACPHIGTPLDWVPGRFLSADNRLIICATHGAEFIKDTGECTRGPCRGDFLERVDFTIQDAILYVSENAGL